MQMDKSNRPNRPLNGVMVAPVLVTPQQTMESAELLEIAKQGSTTVIDHATGSGNRQEIQVSKSPSGMDVIFKEPNLVVVAHETPTGLVSGYVERNTRDGHLRFDNVDIEGNVSTGGRAWTGVSPDRAFQDSELVHDAIGLGVDELRQQNGNLRNGAPLQSRIRTAKPE
jgi:hypothetical protein